MLAYYFLIFSERIAILRTAKVIFQCVTKAKNGQKKRKKGIMFKPAILRL
ncbi:hypothetical protein SEEH1023_07519 [Salmonella enterica subsp. enterica serovar Heidelberg str. 670102-3]|nr:hypothetical protein SEEH1023_07519 [Salmonella enterica subsp. enterica serovar Heidelberg str. 670102-3]